MELTKKLNGVIVELMSIGDAQASLPFTSQQAQAQLALINAALTLHARVKDMPPHGGMRNWQATTWESSGLSGKWRVLAGS